MSTTLMITSLIALFLLYCYAEASSDVAISLIQREAMKRTPYKSMITDLEKQWKEFQFPVHIGIIYAFACGLTFALNYKSYINIGICFLIFALFHSTFHDRFIMYKLSGRLWLLEKRKEFSQYWWDNIWWVLFPKEPDKSEFLGLFSTIVRLAIVINLMFTLIIINE